VGKNVLSQFETEDSSVYKHGMWTQHSPHQLLPMQSLEPRTPTRHWHGQVPENISLDTVAVKASNHSGCDSSVQNVTHRRNDAGGGGGESICGSQNTSFLNVNSRYLVSLSHINFHTLQGLYHVPHWAIAMQRLFVSQWLVKCPFATPGIWLK
jgi:hypothetical protein